MQSLELWLYDVRQIVVRSLQDRPLHPNLVLIGLDEKSAQMGFTIPNLEEFASTLTGVVRSDQLALKDSSDRDGAVRRFRLHTPEGLTPLAEALAQSQKVPPADVKIKPNGLQVGDLQVATDSHGYFYPLFHFADTQAMLMGNSIYRLAPVPFKDALTLGPSLDDKTIVLGPYLQSGQQVDRKTPTGSMTPLELTGTLWDALLQNQAWRPLPWIAQIALTVLWVWVWGAILGRLHPAQAILAFLASSLLWLTLQFGLAWQGYFASVLPALLGLFAYLCATLTLQWPQAARLLEQFSTPHAEPISNEMRQASILFTLLPSYVLQREGEDHEHAARLRREYAQVLGEVCREHDGLILDQQGDAQMVGFGLIHPQQAHALVATAAALELCSRIPELLKGWQVPEESIHCGVCTGPVAWGEVGASQLKAAAAIGDTTNTAARLMGAAKKLGKGVLISEPTFVAAGVRLSAQALEPLQLKGKAEPVPVYHALSVVVRSRPRVPSPPKTRTKIAPKLSLGLCLGSTLGAWLLGPVPLLVWLLWDLPLIQPAPSGPKTVIAGIDPECLQFRAWPWPRELHAQVLKNLERAGARCVFFDVLFDTPGDPQSDHKFAQAIEESLVVVLAGAAGRSGGFAQLTPPPFFPPLDAVRLRAQNRVGLIHTRLDASDGKIRSLPTLYENVNRLTYPAAARAVAAHLGASSNLPMESLIRWHRPVIGGRGWPDYQYVSYHRLLDPNDPVFANLQGSMVMIGDAMPGESDRFETPVGALKGVEVHAMFASTLCQEAPPQDLRSSRYSLALAVLLSGLLAWFGWRAQSLARLCLINLMGLTLAMACHHGLVRAGWVLGQEPVVAVALTAVALLAAKSLLSVAALRRFLPDTIWGELIRSGQARDRTGQGTILVTDIRGYTSLSEKRTPVEVLELLNQYHEETVACYQRHGGSVLTYQGDAQLVVFGLIKRVSNPAREAVLAALELQQVVSRLRSRWNLSPSENFDVGAGLCTGILTVGLLSAGNQQQYTVLGESVRRAHKVQSLSDLVGQSVLLDQATRNLCGDNPKLVQVPHDQPGIGPLFAPSQ